MDMDGHSIGLPEMESEVSDIRVRAEVSGIRVRSDTLLKGKPMVDACNCRGRFLKTTFACHNSGPRPVWIAKREPGASISDL